MPVCRTLCTECRFRILTVFYLTLAKGFLFPSLTPIFGKLQFKGIFSVDFIVILFAFLFVDLFDTIGTLVGVSAKADMLDEEGKLPSY